MKESILQRKILKYLKRKEITDPFYYIKTVTTNRAGGHDVCGCYYGRFVAFEIKADGGVVSSLQEKHLKKINRAMGFAFVVYSLGDVHAAFKLMDKERLA